MAQLETLIVAVADANHLHRTLIGDALRGFGVCSVVQAKDGIRLLQAVKETRPHVVIVAARLPDISGLELTRMIRAGETPLPRDTAVVVTSTDPTGNFLDIAEGSGVDEMLAIPFPPLALRQRLEAVASKRRAFIEAPGYRGPDRRRRQDPLFKGPYRRISDLVRPPDGTAGAQVLAAARGILAQRVGWMRAMAAEGLRDEAGVMRLYGAAAETRRAALAVNADDVAEAIESLLRYMSAAGAPDLIEAPVLDAHLGAMALLCATEGDIARERRFILQGLRTAVDRRIKKLQRQD